MTGFARQEGGDGGMTWTWEIKSVNGKSLDQRCRLPGGYEELEVQSRLAIAERFARGNFQITLNMGTPDRPVSFRVNEALLDQLLALAASLEGRKEAEAPRLDGLLSVRGVVEAIEEEEDESSKTARVKTLVADLKRTLDALAKVRRAEGARLAALVQNHLESIARLVADAESSAATQPAALRQRLKAQLEELLQSAPALPEERLAQEAAILITKADVREEIDRLEAHVAAARELLAGDGPIGRRLDFLCQEFNREANTLCSKAADVDLTRIGLELKTVIDQLREQVQNLE